jgi:hypothetical protein
MTDYLIWSHQHNAWWRDGGYGYTTRLTDAGRFTRTQAEKHLSWDLHREWLPDGRPHEVIVEALHPTLARDILAPTVIASRVEKATYEAIVERAGRAVKP